MKTKIHYSAKITQMSGAVEFTEATMQIGTDGMSRHRITLGMVEVQRGCNAGPQGIYRETAHSTFDMVKLFAQGS